MEPDEIYLCPDCGMALELYANGDNGPSDDRWTCDACCIEYPHSAFPSPPGYIRTARAIDKAHALELQHADELHKLEAWNNAMRAYHVGRVE